MLKNTTGLKEIVEKRIGHMKKRPQVAIYKPKVTSKLVRNLYTETTVRNHVVKCDYAEPAGGENIAPNPIELLMASFAACIEAAFYEFAENEGLAVESVEAEIEGMLDLRGLFMVDDNVPPGFQELSYILKIQSPEDEAKVRKLAEKVIMHCPVVDSLVRSVNVSGVVHINEETAGHGLY